MTVRSPDLEESVLRESFAERLDSESGLVTFTVTGSALGQGKPETTRDSE